MSHHLYNLYASANQSSTQGQYGLPNIQAERDPRSLPSRLGPRSSFNLSGASATSDNSGGILPSLMSQSMSYRPEQSRATMDEHIERSIDMHISRAREEVRISGKLIHQSIDQDTRFTSTHRDELRSSGARMASYPMSSTSTSLGHRHLDIESGSSSMDWSSNYKRPTADDSKSYSSSALFNYASGGDNRFNAPSEREHDMKSIPGLGDYDYPLQDKPAAPTESSRPKHTSESAVDILLRFGLEKEDLEYLISYPEDQITPATLPFILRQIRTQKAKRATTAVQPKSYPETQPTRSLSGMDGHTLSSYGRAGMRQEEMASSVLQPSKVIDYGHTGKYTGGVGDNIGRSSGSRANSGGSGSMLLMDTYDTSRHNREPLQKNTTGMKSSALSSSREQASSVTSLSSSYSSIPNSGAAPSHDQTKGFQSQPNQTSQTVLGSFSLPKKDTDIRVFKSEGFKPVPLKEPVADRQSTSKTQPSRTLLRGVHPSRPGLVLIGSNDNSGTKGQSKTQGQGSAVAEQMKKRQIHQQKQPMQQMQKQPMQQMQKQPMQQMQKQPMQQMQKQPVQQMQKQPMQQMQKQPMAQQSQHQMQTMQQQQQSQPVSQTGLEMWPPVFSAANSVPPVILSNTDASQTLRCPVLTTGDPRPIFFPPAQPHPILALLSLNPKTMPTSNRQPPAKTGVSKSLPMPAMMHDYAAASPRIFPHTCSLCNKECTCMKDWISHQNTSLHLEKCKYLRKQYPDWDGEIILESRAAGKDAKPSPSTSAQTSQHHREKTRHGSRSCSRSPSHSPSPRRHRGSEGRREKRSSRSRSPHGSRYAHRSQSRSLSPRYDRPTSYRYRSHSWSPERRPSPRRRDDRRSSPTRSRERRSSPRRGEERGSPPRRSDKRRSPPRRSRERRSPPRRGEERGSPPRRSDERRSPPRRSRERRSPPRRGEERGSPPRRSDERRSPPRRSRESRSSTEGSSPQRNKSSSAGRLVKKLLETSAVRSLSKQSDLEVMVKTLTPALLAELAKMESPSSSSSSSSSSTAKKKVLTLKPSKAKPSLQKSEARSSTKTKSGKSSPPTMVKLQGITSCHSHNDVVAAVEQFGKTKSVVLFRSKLEAIVCFEKEEDAKKLKSAESFDVKGMAVAVVREKETVSMEQKKPPQKKPATSSVSTPQTTKATTTSTTTNVPLPTPNMPPLKGLLPSGAKKATTGKLTNQKIAAKGSVKGLTTVTKAKVLVSKAKNISTKQIAKTVKTGTLSAKEAVKKKMSSGSKCTAPDNQSDSGESAMVLKEAASQMQQRVSSSPTEAAVGDPATAAETQTNAASAKDASVTTEPTAAAVSERQPAASTPSLTEKHLHRDRIHCLKMQTCFSKKLFLLDRTVLLVTELPKFYDGCYTEEDVAELLAPFGFEYKDDTIYIDPQTCMAFVMMPTAVNTHNIILFSAKNGIFLKGSRLGFHVVNTSVTMTPFCFYKYLMKLMNSSGSHDGVRAIFIKNISPSEVRDLREALKKIGSVTNFVPFLNKVFIEFERNHDADRLGVWFSLLKQAPGYEVHRLMVPHITHASLSPRLPENALPDCKDVVAGATIPPVEFGVPQGSMPPFWVTLRTSPFVFPTLSPWFIIPEYLTVRGMADIEEASGRGYTNPTIMLTGLPEGDYKHEDVAKLVWQYFPKQNLHSLYYNVTVLTLQRRAFVYFADWTTCCDFVRDHITNPVSVRGCTLTVHFVLQHMNPESSEEMMYKTLMKWSNAGVLEPKSLEERLLCVETSESSVAVVGSIMEAVASITTFVSFLPLANRICIEMADSSGVTQVVEKCKGFSPDSFEKRWSKVLRVETLKSLKQRLQDASDIPINFEADTLYDEADSPAVKCQTLPPSSELLDTGCQATLQASCPDGSTISEPTTAGPSATTASDVAMKEEDEKPGSEITISSFGPEANVDVEKVKREEGSLTTSISTADVTSTSGASSGNTDPAASSPSPSGTQLQPEENFAELPQINTEIFKALTAAVRQHRLTRESRSQSEEKENPSKTVTSSTVVTAEDTPQRMGQDDVTDDIVSSDSYHFEEQKLNIDDFVTVDEVGDNVEDTSPEAHSSSSSSRARRERQSSGVSSCGKQTSTRSLKDSKSSASPSSSSSKSTKGSSSSSSRSGSPKMSKGSSDPTKSPTKPSSSAGVSKPSSSSSPLSTETLSSPGQKTQQSRSKSPAKASNTASSGRSTRSSSAACKREKITSAATVDASIDAHPELLRVKAKATEVAVAKSDHKVSAEGIAAKTVESETKTSLEMHPPPQGHEVELSQAQSLNIDFNISTLKDRKTSKEERNKHTEGEDNSSENYQILDSLDDQTDEQMDDGDQDGICETQQTGPEEGHTLHEDSCQVLDSVDDEGKALPEEYSEMEMDGSFQVLDSVTENKDDISTRKQLSEEDAITVVDNSGDKFAVKDAEGKDQEINNKENFQVLDTDSKQALSGMADGKRKRQKEEEIKGKILSVESCKASKNVENPDGQITNEDGDYKDDLKDHNSDITEQETFEVLDSIDDQTATEDDCQKLETPNDQISKEHIRPIEEEGDTYQVIDSLEDQPATTETESETDKKDKTKKGEAITRKDDGPSKRSGPTTTAAKNEEKEKSAKKQDRVVKKHETQMKRDTTAGVSIIDKEIEEATEEMVCEIVDSVEDEPVQDAATTERSGRRRSARGKKEDKITLNLREASQRPVRDEEATYKILDSVEDETANDEPTVTTRFTRGKRERTSFSSSSSKSTKGSSSSNSRSVSPKMSKDFTVSKPSSSSSPLSTETLFSAGQKTQESRTKSPAKASNTTFSRRSIRSSSAAHEKEKVMSAANVEASMESHPDLLREDAKATEVTVAKIKASSEIHSPPQEHGLKSSQAQGLEADFNVNALKDQKKSKEERKEGDVDKHTEEDDDDDGENYQILDSLDDQTDEQMDEGDRDSSTETLQTGPEKGHTLHDGSYQVLDSVDDEGKAHPEQHSEMDGSFQVLDNVTEDQAATGQEDSHLVQDDNSTVTQLSEEEANPVVDNSVDAVKDAVAENQETNGKDNLQVLDTGSIQAPKGMGDGKKKEQKEEEIEGKMRSAESCQAFKDVENPDGQIPNEDQPLQEPYKEDSLKDPDCHVTEQETFEVLDSIDDQTATEDDSQKRETSSGHLSKEHIRPIEEEGDTYQVIDSLEDQPATTETESETDKKGKRTKKGEAITRKDDGPSKRSGPTTTVSKSKEKEKSPKKQDRMIKKHETQTKRDTTVGVSVKDKEFEEATEEMVYEIVDSVEDEPVQDAATTERRSKRRSARGKKEDKITLNLTEASQRPIREEDAEYEILDSVEDETADDETTVTTRSTRGKRERTSKQDALIEKRKKEDTPTRRMRTPARESQERNREKTPKKEEKPPPKESTPTKKSDVVREVSEEDATYIIFDSVDDEIVKADPPATGQKGKRGRSKKEVKTTKEDSITLKKGDKDAFEKVTDEEEATYQILDSVEDETVDDKPPTGLSENSRKENISRNDEQTKNSTSLAGSTKNEEEEEPMFEIVDSLEDDQEELTATEVSDEGRKEKSQTISETPPKEESSGEKGDTPTCGATVVEMSGKAIVKEESLYEIVDDLEEVSDDPSAAEGSGRSNKKRASKTGKKKEDKSTTNSWSDRMTEEKEKKQKSPERNDALSILVNLDEVSDEEEDYPDDTTEEEELRKRQAATKERQFEKEREARRTRERERRSRSSSGRGGGDRGGTRRAKVRGKGNEEKVEEDTKEMVTLDEVGGDEPGEESVPESRDWDGEITEGETQALVTLDEFIEEEEDGTAEQCTLKTRPFSQEEGSVDSLNPESLVTVDGAGDDEEQAEKTSRSAKRQHNDDTEESTTFVTVDEVGEVEEEEETVTTVTRGRAKKRPRQTPVRKSTRGKKVSTKDEREEEEKEPVDVLPPASLDASSPSDKDPSTLSSDGQPEFQRKEVEAASRADVDAASAGQKPQPERPENQTVEGGEEEKKGWSRTDIKVVSKRRREPVGPEAKRSRSQSPCVAADFKLPPFKPNNPLGQEFVVPKSGYFCNLCSIFYLNEQTAKERHCSSQRHYDNLQKHYQKLEQKSSRTSTQSSQSSVSD